MKSTVVSYPICALNPAYEVLNGLKHSSNFCPMASDSREAAISSMSPEQVKQAIKLTLIALDKALDFFDNVLGKTAERIDYVNFLIGFFVFHPEDLTDEVKEYLKNWYCNVSFENTSITTRRNISTNLIEMRRHKFT